MVKLKKIYPSSTLLLMEPYGYRHRILENEVLNRYKDNQLRRWDRERLLCYDVMHNLIIADEIRMYGRVRTTQEIIEKHAEKVRKWALDRGIEIQEPKERAITVWNK